MRIPLPGGAYSARSPIAACTRSVNYYPEKNPDGPAIIPYTQYQAPGLVPLVQDAGNKKPVRQVYRASNGDGYCVIGQQVYYIAPNWALTALGVLVTVASNPVYFIDNGLDILLVDGSPEGYTINLASRAFAQIVDPFFNGAVRCDVIDGFMLWNVPGTRQFKSTLDNQITPLDPTYIATKNGYPDKIQVVFINRRQILLLGTVKSEIWYNVGGTQFPFAEVPGTYIEHGAASMYSAAASDISVFWLGQSLRGTGYVMRQQGYNTKIISNYAISEAIRKMPMISDAIGFTYTQGGHEFYYLVFPSANQTWVYDDSIGDANLAWHQRCWTDAQGALQRDRANCCAWLYGKNVVGDWENGSLYALDLDTYTDTVDGVEYAKSFIRTFPHLTLSQVDPQGSPPAAMGQQVQFNDFRLDLECGKGQGGPVDGAGVPTPDQIGLRWSVDRGRTWGNTVLQSTGRPGEYATQPQWGALGLARDALFEISHSIKGPVALNGAWIRTTLIGN